ncbi:LysE family translocator [Allopusillimonas soli]|uniref:LysE family translocator n=2 Tax=Allopusillimonas soli TaxID=659016 RepID=A0A853F8D8_9BURK|nr:LysE family translocator [Allopusillimonas soli]NYT35822.1 LysE family translocator [Allopusillimonas soli]TEA76752.1 LysE family translocator [Allopusillimonas soli]
MSFDFFLTSLVIIAAPGTGALYTMAAGLSDGKRASIIAAFGCTLGIVPHMLAAISGLAALFHTNAAAFQVLKYLGTVYLLYMAWTMFRHRGMLTIDGQSNIKSARQLVVSAVLINLLNPKLSVFFLAFLPQFIGTEEAAPIARMLVLSLVFMTLTFVIFAGYGTAAATLRRHVLANPSVQVWIRHGFAIALAGLALQLALAER